MPFQKNNTLGKQFQKGQSGNPNGRPPKSGCISDLVRERLKETIDNASVESKIVDVLIENALSGDRWAIQTVLERTEGKIKDKIEHSGESLQHVVILPDNGRGGFVPAIPTSNA